MTQTRLRVITCECWVSLLHFCHVTLLSQFWCQPAECKYQGLALKCPYGIFTTGLSLAPLMVKKPKQETAILSQCHVSAYVESRRDKHTKAPWGLWPNTDFVHQIHNNEDAGHKSKRPLSISFHCYGHSWWGKPLSVPRAALDGWQERKVPVLNL